MKYVRVDYVKMRKIKVGMITLDNKFGLGSHTLHLTRELAKIPEIDLQIINLINGKCNEIANIDKSAKCTVHNINRSKQRFAFIRGISDIIKILKRSLKIKPDVLHIHFGETHLILATILLKNKFPVICTLHSLYARDEKMLEYVNLSRCVYRKILSFIENHVILKNLPNIIVVTPPMKELIVNKTNAKIYTIPNGADPTEAPDVVPLSIEYPSILYVGRLTKRKGVDILLRAIPIVKKSIPNIMTYIMGDGPQEKELKELVVELNITDNVKFLGFVSGKEKYAHYKSADICVVPSLDYDYAPIVLPEAMMCEKPIIASNVGGIPFLVEDGRTGLLIRPGDFNELGNKILELLKNEKMREEMGKAGRRKIENFTWSKIARQTVSVYREVIDDYESKKGGKNLGNFL